MPGLQLIDVGNNTIRNQLLVRVPILAILFLAVLIVATLPVDKQNGKVHDVEVGDGRAETSGQRPSERHQEVTEIVRVSGTTPPARREQFRPRSSGEEFEVLRVLSVPEVIFLAIRTSENVVSREVHEEYGSCPDWSELYSLEHQESSLERVNEWDPC